MNDPRIVVVPAVLLQIAVVTDPVLSVSRVIACWPFWANAAKVDERLTEVSAGTGTPFCLAVATTSAQLPALVAGIGWNCSVSPLFPGPGFGVPVGPGLSAEQPAISPAAAIAARAAILFHVRRMGASLGFGVFALRIRILA
jgi:hypothetical protein